MKKRIAEVKGKGRKIRQIHFPEECSLVLKEYLKEQNSLPTDPLFKNKYGTRLSIVGFRTIVNKIGKKARLSHSLYPHCCRHTFATNMLARGADLQFIVDELGHSNINTTCIYAKIPPEEMRAKHQNIMG